MYNYLKNGVSLNAEVMATINNFEVVVRTLAIESVEHTSTVKPLEDALKEAVKANDTEEAKNIESQIEAIDSAWAIRKKALEFQLFGGKDDKGNKVDGICSFVSDDLYKAYVAYVSENKTAEYRAEIKKFVLSIVNEDSIKDGAFNHLFIDIKTVMSSTRLNSNSQLAKGSAFITTVNKRTFKKMLLGAICDIASNNHTLKVKKNNK